MKTNLYSFASKEMNLRPALCGIFHDENARRAVVTDGCIMIVSRNDYDENNAGKIIAKDGSTIDARFPKWQEVMPKNNKYAINMDTLRRAAQNATNLKKNLPALKGGRRFLTIFSGTGEDGTEIFAIKAEYAKAIANLPDDTRGFFADTRRALLFESESAGIQVVVMPLVSDRNWHFEAYTSGLAWDENYAPEQSANFAVGAYAISDTARKFLAKPEKKVLTPRAKCIEFRKDHKGATVRTVEMSEMERVEGLDTIYTRKNNHGGLDIYKTENGYFLWCGNRYRQELTESEMAVLREADGLTIAGLKFRNAVTAKYFELNQGAQYYAEQRTPENATISAEADTNTAEPEKAPENVGNAPETDTTDVPACTPAHETSPSVDFQGGELTSAVAALAGQQAPALTKHLAAAGIREFSDLTKSKLYAFRDSVLAAVAGSSARTYFATLKGILARYEDERPICREYRDILRARAEKPLKVYLTPAELSRLESVTPRTPAEATILREFLVCAYTGMRVSDADRIGPENIRDGRLTYTSKKTGITAVVPVRSAVMDWIKWINRYPCNVSLVYYNDTIRELCRRAGITETVKVFKAGRVATGEKWEFVSSHTARISFCTCLQRAGLNLLDISRMAGHTSTTMTERYCVPDGVQLTDGARAFLGVA